MNRYLIKVLMSICIMGVILLGSVVEAEENATANATESVNVTATATVTPTQEPIAEPTEGKFRVGPTVTLRPVNDVVDKSQDGLVELYINNPSVNNVTLTTDVQISVPSGIHVYGEGFGYGGAAGTVAGKFEVPPGTVRTIHINIKGEKTGDFTVHFTGLYWPGDDKDAFQQISLTHPLTVNEPSPNPLDLQPTDYNSDPIDIIDILYSIFHDPNYLKPSGGNNVIIIYQIIENKSNLQTIGILSSIIFFLVMLIYGAGTSNRRKEIKKQIDLIKTKIK